MSALTLALAYTPPDAGWLVYRAGSTLYLTRGRGLGSSISLECSWQESGFYAFATEEFDDFAGLSAQAERLTGACFVWLAPREDWGADYIVCRIDACAESGDRRLARMARMGVNAFFADVREGTVVSATEDGFLLSSPDERPALCLYAVGAAMAGVSAAIIGSTLRFETDASGLGDDTCKRLGVRIEYARVLPPSADGLAAFSRARVGHAERIAGAILSGHITSFGCRIDPARMFDPDRTYMAIPAGTALTSGLSSPAGRDIPLKATNASRLALQRAVMHAFTRSDGLKDARTTAYLGPHGAFDAAAPQEEGTLKILCGLSGTEYIECDTNTHRLFFEAGQDAFMDGSGSLSDRSTASYVRFPDGARYICQPRDAPFFGNPGTHYLPFLDVPAAVLHDCPPVPLMTYLRRSGAMTPATLEGVLAPARRTILLPDGACMDGLSYEETVGVTAQGLSAGIMPGGDWAWLGLANTGPDAPLANMRLTNPSPALRRDFQQDTLRLIYTDPRRITDHAEVFEGFDFTVDGWTFKTSPAGWRRGDSPTAMLMQFSTGTPMRAWAGGEPAVQTALKAAYNEDGAVKERYTEFISVMDDPMFQGIVLLNCAVSADRSFGGYMDEMAPVLDSIDMGALFAHHIIIYRSRIRVEDGLITVAGASVSALVDYAQPGAAPYSKDENPPDYAFTTTEFTLVVHERQIARIQSTSELILNRIFASPARMEQGGNGLMIAGRLAMEGNTPIYAYSLTGIGEYTLTGSAVETVWFDAARLVRDGSQSLFLLSGRMGFVLYEMADLFCYGSDGGGKIDSGIGGYGGETVGEPGLRFDGLAVSHRLENGRPTMDMRYDRVLLRPADSAARGNSLTVRFPAFVKRFAHSPQGAAPPDYTSIETPVAQGELTAPWFGLEYEIPLGGLGALSPGGLSLTLLAAWSPGEASPSLYFGAPLPGASALRLQGVFEIGFAAASLNVIREGGQAHFTLVLHQFAIRALGIAFPPGENSLKLFPDGEGRRLGWFAAYKEG